MPELPDLQVYLEAIGERAAGRALLGIELRSPFLLRTVQPPLTAFHGLKLTSLKLLGKRICFGFEGDLWLALHLMIAGRLLADRALSRLLKQDWPRLIGQPG